MLADTTVDWLGMFARDYVPKADRRQLRPFALVFNSDPADQPGTHWLAFYEPAEPQESPLEMFDSYGMSHKADAFSHLASRIRYSDVTYQSLDSSVCGHYCLFYLFHRTHGFSYEPIEQRSTRKCIVLLPTRMSLSSLIRFNGRVEYSYHVLASVIHKHVQRNASPVIFRTLIQLECTD